MEENSYLYECLMKESKECLVELYMGAMKKEHDVLSYVLNKDSTFDGSKECRDYIVKLITNYDNVGDEYEDKM